MSSGQRHPPLSHSVVEDATTADELVGLFAAKLTETLRTEAPMHRLWYDLRSQSTFEPGLRDAVALIDTTLEHMVWRVVERYSELAGRPVALRPAAAYAVLDGVFQQALVAHQTRGPVVLDELAADVHDLMPLVLTAS